MKALPFILLPAVFLATSSCDRPQPADPAPVAESAGLYTTPGREWPEAGFTPWMSRAELQHLQETNSAVQYFARVEGRNHDGRMEYRASVMEFPSEQYDQWAVFWGISEAELFDWELRLLKSGFIRDNMQVCADPTGKICHQIVWLKPAGAQPDEAPVAPVTSEQVIAGQSIPPEPPAEAEPVPEAPALGEPEPAPKPVAKKPNYVVKPGDTLGKIAKLRGSTVAGIKSANGLKNDIVRIGQKLVIPPKN